MLKPRTPAQSPARLLVLAAACSLAFAVALTGCNSAQGAGVSLLPTPLPTATFSLDSKFATAAAQAWTPTLPPDAAQHAPVPGIPAQWGSANLPAGFGLAYHESWMGVSAENGNIAYSCSQMGTSLGGSAPVETVKTWNAGGSWTRMANLNQPWDGCANIVIDDLNPAIAIMDGMGGTATQDNIATTTDGGQSWHARVVPPIGYVEKLASVGGRTYGIFVASDKSATLDVSVDGLVSWQDISGPMAHQGLIVFWANPYTGTLLAETNPPFPGPVTLWRSSDGGAHWSSVALPFSQVGAVIVKAATSSAPWTLCLDQGSTTPGGIACSTDSGAHWQVQPAVIDAGLRGYGVIGVADDGAVLADGMADSFQRLYRLPPGATRWQSLGDVPPTTGTLLYTHTSASDGVLWSFPEVKGGGSGDANPSNVYKARYPY
jgi:hypothetical protein